MYLSYVDYGNMGGELEETAFERLALRAQKYVDRLTHGRLQKDTDVRRCVQLAMWALIGAMQESDEHGGRSVEQMSNDNVSVRYAAVADERRYAQIVREYLAGEVNDAGTELLYAGVDA